MNDSARLQGADAARPRVPARRRLAFSAARALVAVAALLVGSPAFAQQWGWEWIGPQPDSPLIDAVWDSKRYVAVDYRRNEWGERWKSFVWTSSDGATWRIIARPDHALNSVVWNGSVYVAVGSGVVSSPDGVTWTDRTPSELIHTGLELDRVVWSGQRFVAVGYLTYPQPARGVVLTSPDGVVWAAQALPDVDLVRAVASNGRTLLALARRGQSGMVLTSSDGLAWTPGTAPPDLDSSYPKYEDVCWIGDAFATNDSFEGLWTSQDGATWSWVAYLGHSTWGPWRIGWNGSLAVAACDGLFTSTDGTTWTEQVESIKDEYLRAPTSLASNGTQWSVGGYLTSPDGVTWHDLRFSLKAGATSGDTEVAVGDNGMILVNRNDTGWRYAESPTTASLVTVVWDGEQFLAAGAERALVASTDGVAWQHRTSGLDADIVRLVWTGSRFVAQLAGGGLAHSTDGAEWSRATTPGELVDVASAGWRLVGVGKGGLVATSHDGVTWTRQPPPTSADLASVTWTGKSFVAVGAGPTVLRSADGERWQLEPAPTDNRASCTISSLDSVTSEGDLLLVWATSTCYGTATRTYWLSSDTRGWISTAHLFIGHSRDSRIRKGQRTTVLGKNSIQRQEGAEIRTVVPMAAHTQGVNGTFWRTDLEVLNRGSEVARYEVELMPRVGRTGPAPLGSFVVQPGASRRHRDILDTVEGAGALRVRTLAGQIEVTSRTATDGATGTAGQLVPGIPEEEAYSSGHAAGLVGLSQAPDRSGGFRSNLGIVNLAEMPIALTVAIHLPSGALLGTIEATAPAGSLLQLDEVIRRVTQAPVPAAYALVSSSTRGAAFLAWASVVDNRTGDPTLVMAR